MKENLKTAGGREKARGFSASGDMYIGALEECA